MPTLVEWLTSTLDRQARHERVRAEILAKHPPETVKEELEAEGEKSYLEGFRAALHELAEHLRAEWAAGLEALPEPPDDDETRS